MKNKILIPALALCASSLFAGDAGNGYAAHEWGTFTSVQGSDGVILRWNSLETSLLPTFVYSRKHPFNDPALDLGSLMLEGKTDNRWLQRMETPVIYFYADREQAVDVQVNFPQGLVTEWYPQVSGFGPTPALQATVPQSTNSFARWDHVTILPPKKDAPAVQLRGDSQGSHYFTARETDAALLRLSGGIAPQPRTEEERFLFYRGVGNFETPLSVSVDSARAAVMLKNGGPEPLNHLFLLEVSREKAAFISVNQLPSGTTREVPRVSASALKPLAETSTALAQALTGALEAEGLYPAEAAAMVKTWQDSWFAEPGMRVLYLLPAAWTARTLPLTMTPAPARLVRVMVGRAEVFTPALEEKLQQKFTEFENPPTRARAVAAMQALQLGRFQEPAIARLAALLASQKQPPQDLPARMAAFVAGTREKSVAWK